MRKIDRLRIENDHTMVLESNGEKERYSVKENPSLTSTLVQRKKMAISYQMDFKGVTQNIDNALYFFGLASHSLCGYKECSQVLELLDKLRKKNAKDNNSISNFFRYVHEGESASVSMFDSLENGNEQGVIHQLERVSSTASNMSKIAQEFIKDYQEILDATSTIVKAVIAADVYKERFTVEKEIALFKVEQDNHMALQEVSRKRLDILYKEYEDLCAAELAEEENQQPLGIMGAIFNFIGNTASAVPDYVTAQIRQPTKAQRDFQRNRSNCIKAINSELIQLENQETKKIVNLKKYARYSAKECDREYWIGRAEVSLITVVSCLETAVAKLKDIVKYWNSMEKNCKVLKNSDLEHTVRNIYFTDQAERMAFYSTDNVMFPLLNYMVHWSAINSHCQEYIEATRRTEHDLSRAEESRKTARWNRDKNRHITRLLYTIENNLDIQFKESLLKTTALSEF